MNQQKNIEYEEHKRHIVYGMSVAAVPHISDRPENRGVLYRKFALDVPDSHDRRLMVRSLFNGPTDANFFVLVTELSDSLLEVLQEAGIGTPPQAHYHQTSAQATQAEQEAGSTTDTSSETEPNVKNS